MEEWKCSESQMFVETVQPFVPHLSAWFYCRSENQSTIYVAKKREKRAFSIYSWVCFTLSAAAHVNRAPYGLNSPVLSYRQELSAGIWADHTSQTAQTQRRYVSILVWSTFCPSLSPFYLTVFPILPLSLVLSSSCFILLFPVISPLWSGPRWIRVGHTGSLTRG